MSDVRNGTSEILARSDISKNDIHIFLFTPTLRGSKYNIGEFKLEFFSSLPPMPELTSSERAARVARARHSSSSLHNEQALYSSYCTSKLATKRYYCPQGPLEYKQIPLVSLPQCQSE